MEFARAFHARSYWADVAMDEEATEAFMASLEDNDNAYFVCSDHGFIGGIIMPLFFAPTTRVGAELFWYSERGGAGRLLREGFEAWSAARGAPYVQFSTMLHNGGADLAEAMTRDGYEAFEMGLRKRVAPWA